MAYISYNKLGESEFDNIVSKRYKIQDLNNYRLKLEVHNSFKKDEKITTKIEPVDNEDVRNKAFLHEKISKIDGQISYLQNVYNEFKLHQNKQSLEEILIQRPVKMTIQNLYDQGLFDTFYETDEVSKDFLFTSRRRVDLK